MKKILLTASIFLLLLNLSAQSVQLIKDIYLDTESSSTYQEDSVLVFNDLLYFIATDSAHGKELWKFDGNQASLVKDIKPGVKGSGCRNLYICNNKVLFTANDSIHGNEWWETDGTELGTKLVADIYPGTGDGVYDGSMSAYRCFKVFKNKIYFNGQNDADNHELWATDGTEAGTTLIKNIANDYSSFNMESFPIDFETVGDTLFFNTSGRGIWKTAGEPTNTLLASSLTGASDFCAMDGYLLFKYSGDLWRCNGTDAGSTNLGTIGYPGDINWFGKKIVRLGNKAYFAGTDATHGNELWVTDGTTAGTKMLIDAWPGTEGYSPQNMLIHKNQIYYKGNDGVHDIELWTSDGTEAGTHMVADIGKNDAGLYLPSSIYSDGNLIYMNAGGSFQSELWVSDGTENGTYEIDIHANGYSSPKSFKTFKNKLFCFAFTYELGYEPYFIDVNKSTEVKSVKTNISIGPNPASDFVNIQTDNNNVYNLSLLNLNGNIITTLDFQTETKVNIQTLPKGCYILGLRNKTSNTTSYSKLIKK